MSWRFDEEEKFDGISLEKELEERSRYRRLAVKWPEILPERKFPARFRIWRLVRLKSSGGTSPEKELLLR